MRIQQILRRTGQWFHQSNKCSYGIGRHRTDRITCQRGPIQWWMVVFGCLNKVSIDALRIDRTARGFRAATVSRFVADMSGGVCFSARAYNSTENGREEYCDEPQNCCASKHGSIVLWMPAH